MMNITPAINLMRSAGPEFVSDHLVINGCLEKVHTTRTKLHLHRAEERNKT